MKRMMFAAAAAAVVLTGAPAHAATIVSENFDTGLGAFTASSGSIIRATARPYQGCCGVSGTAAPLDNPFVTFGTGDVPNTGSLATAFQTVAGELYTLAFRVGAFGSGTTNLSYQVGGITNLLSLTANNNADTTFQNVSFDFVGTGGSTNLSFSSQGAGLNIDPLLDDVTVTSAVPEPATWAMMLLGFGAVGSAARYRGRKTSLVYA